MAGRVRSVSGYLKRYVYSVSGRCGSRQGCIVMSQPRAEKMATGPDSQRLSRCPVVSSEGS
jgi:hypothetical protein